MSVGILSVGALSFGILRFDDTIGERGHRGSFRGFRKYGLGLHKRGSGGGSL